MTPTHDGDLSPTTQEKDPCALSWARWLLLALVVLLAAGGAAGWLLRKAVARQILVSWCVERDLVCTGQFGRLGLGGASLDDLTISGEGKRAFEAGQVRVRLEWPGLFNLRVAGVDVDAPVVRGALSDGRLTFHGLERLTSPSGGSGGRTFPAFQINDGRILIETSAGEVGASVSASGVFPEDARASLTLDPASLDGAEGYISWTGGTAELSAKDGQLEGQTDIALEEVRTDDVHILNAKLVARLEAGTEADSAALLVWDGQVAEATGADFSVVGMTTSGQVRLNTLTGAAPDEILAAVTGADIQLEAGKAQWTDYAADGVRAEASLHGQDGHISGTVDIDLTELSLPQGRAGQLAVAGDLDWATEAGFGFAGQVNASKAALADTFSGSFLSRVSLPAPLTAHGGSLRAALRRALSNFDAQARVSVDIAKAGTRISVQDAASLTAASGLKLAITPRSGEAVFSLVNGQATLEGDISLKGGGAPKLFASLKSLSFGNQGLNLSAEAIRLSDWREGGVQFGADIPSLSVQSGGDELDVQTSGTLTLSGPVFGVELADSKLSGGVQITQVKEGLRVEPVGQRCLVFDTKGVGLGGIDFEAARLNVCPRTGVFMKPGNGPPSGTASLGDVSWPFASKSVTGVLSLKDAVVDWSADKGFAFTLSSPSLGLPLQIDNRTLTIDAARPRVSLSTAKGRAPALSATLNDTVFGGTLIPAKVSADKITFNGQIGSGGLSGDLAGDAVLIRDFREDPIYQPLLSDMTARMNEWQLALKGPLRLQASGIPIGEIRADVNVLKLDGTAHVATLPLDFAKGGLQPVMLSERLRGVYTDAAGHMEAVSDVTLAGGKMDGTADVSVSNFGFQTTRLGRVSNVNGDVRFSDLFSLTTEPSQVVTIGGMNPGVPLSDGRLVFGFSEGRDVAVESAAFPFAGGTLALSPFNWVLGREDQHVEVTADAIDLAKLVSILKLPKIEAEGTVSGRFPIDVERSKVLIRNARLFADDGGGRVAYLGDAADSAAQSDANVRLAFEALKDFDFTVLEVGLDGDVADRIKITLKLAGKSRNDITYGSNAEILRGQPFEFNIGVDSALAELFRSSQFYTNQQKLTDFVVQEVITDRGLKPAKNE